MTAASKAYFAALHASDLLHRSNDGEGGCPECKFWLIDWKDEKRLAAGSFVVVGRCHRRAPVPPWDFSDMEDKLGAIAWATEETASVEHTKDNDYGNDSDFCTIYGWPKTGVEDWCGEFEAGRKAYSAAEIEHLESLYAAMKQEDEAREQAKTAGETGADEP